MNLPALPLEAWENTKITLHLYLQILGKIKLALAPRKNHWWHITLKPHATGLTTGWIPAKPMPFSMVMDFVNHELRADFADGDRKNFKLQDGLTVAEFYQKVMRTLEYKGIKAKIQAVPYDHPCKEPFADCLSYHSYDHEAVERFHKVLQFVASVLEKFRSRFLGKVSPVQLYWHHMDLAVTRFNGKEGPEPAENANAADRDAYSHEVISAGFWAGDENVRGAAFYSYTFPSPEGLENASLAPEKAWWDMSSGSPMAMLMYDDLLQLPDPENALLDFLETSYQAGATRGYWPEDKLIYKMS